MLKLPLLALVLLMTGMLSAQVTADIHPEWSVSNGMHDHTSRDELHFTVDDNAGSFIAVASVERDSTFSDILTQKLSPAGEIIWQTRFSSGLGLDYDYPVKVLVDAQNDIYILGSTVTISGQGAGYLVKYSSSGMMEWAINLADYTVAHEYYSFFDAYLDGDNLRVTYTCRGDTIIPAQTFFLSVSPAGVVSNIFKRTGIGQPSGSFAYGENSYIDHAGNFVFILRDENQYSRFYIRRIHPGTGADTTFAVSDALLQPSEKPYLQYIDWQFIRQAENGDVYAASNFSINPTVYHFYLLRMNADGVIQYISESTEFTPIADFQDIIPMDSSVVVTGVVQHSNTYLWELDAQGMRAKNAVLQQNGKLIPQRLIRRDGALFLHAISAQGHEAYLFNLDEQFQPLWVHQLSLPPGGSDLAGNDVLTDTSGNFLACGTLRAKKHSNSVFYSEEDLFLEMFHPQTPGFYWQFIHSDLGTSHVVAIRHAVSADNRVTVITQEKTGPEPAFVGGSTVAPSKYYAYQYDTDGNLIWSVLLPYQVQMDYFYSITQSDQLGNVYLPCTGALLKIRNDGATIDSIIVPSGISRFLLAANGKVFAANNIGIVVIDEAFSQVQQFPVEGVVTKIFQLPGSDAVYAYTINNDSAIWQIPPRLLLYKNGLLQWKYTLPAPMFSTTYITALDSDPLSGGACFCSYSSSQSTSQLHRIGLDGSSPLSTPPASDLSGQLYCLDNGRFYLYTPNKLTLFDATLNAVSTHTLPGPGYVFSTLGARFYAAEFGSLSIFDADGNFKAQVFSPEITGFVEQTLPGPANSLYTDALEGRGFFTTSGNGGLFGWRWFRGVLKKFDLNNLLSSTGSVPPQSGNKMTGYPNPVANWLSLTVPEIAQNQPVQMNLTTGNGELVRSLNLDFAPPVIGIDCQTLPPGHYVAQLVAKGRTWVLLFQKI